VDARRLAEKWAVARGTAEKADKPDPMQERDALAWLITAGVGAAVLRVLLLEVRAAMTEGYWIGFASAGSVLLGTDVDWGSWVPGDLDAARLVLDEQGGAGGLLALLDAADVRIRSVSANLMDDLARALALSLARGESAATLAADLRDILDDATRAWMVAVTEISRASSAATLDRYQAAGVEASEWMTALDDRVCPICDGNEQDGPVPLRSAFSSGDTQPPAHPLCRCALSPTTLTGPEAAAALAGAGIEEESA
jgi:SPP1 gp7 family putative phage head morphogenesis protein